nr:putative ribonuclease H protein [Ipomoea batatas]
MLQVMFERLGCNQRVIGGGVQILVRNWHKKREVKVAWERPEVGWTKLNFDGSCKCKTGKSSIGGVFRNHEAEFLLGYAESIGKSNSTVAELAALRRGLELVAENGWTRLWLEGDSKSLVDVVRRKKRVRCEESQRHLDRINVIIPELEKCVVGHVFREGNRAADKLAQIGHNLRSPQVWHRAPSQLLRILNDDAHSKIFIRRM